MLVDAAAMHLLRRPTAFDVCSTENMFGDILTDETSMLVRLARPAAVRLARQRARRSVRTIHDRLRTSAGRGIANPIGTILSGALLLRTRWTRGEAVAVESAVARALAGGLRTADIAPARVIGLRSEAATHVVITLSTAYKI